MQRRMTVVGTGYLGVTHAACLAEMGYEVLGLDTDEAKIAMLTDGRVPFYEPELEPLLRKHIDDGRLRFTTSYADAAAFGDVHFICVGTPAAQRRPGGRHALRPRVDRVARPAARAAGAGGREVDRAGRHRALGVGPPARAGTGRHGRRPGLEPGVPARGLRGARTRCGPDRLVIGSDTPGAAALLREVYQPLLDAGVPLVETDLATAELVKAAANSFLATKISFINAMAEVCETTGADIVALAEAIGHDERIGKRFLNAGLGFGGGCLPKDIRAFMARAEELGVESALAFLKEVDAINNRRRSRMVDLARTQIGGSFEGTAVAVLGAAFKPDSDDIRDSPALDVAVADRRRGRAGAGVRPEGDGQRPAPLPGSHVRPVRGRGR